MSEPSPAYFEALKATQKLHANTKKFNGRFLWRYLDVLEPALRELGCKTLLDYGSGKGKQWATPLDESGQLLADRLGVEVTMYDPGLSQYSKLPVGKFDAVVCTQVLGSIPVADLPWVVDRMYGYADKLLFVGERLRKVRKKFLDHMKDQMPHEWSHEQWEDALRRPDHGIRVLLKTKNGSVKISDL